MTEALSYRNQSIDLLCKSMDYLLDYRDLSQERVKCNYFTEAQKMSQEVLLSIHCWSSEYTIGSINIKGIQKSVHNINSINVKINSHLKYPATFPYCIALSK